MNVIAFLRQAPHRRTFMRRRNSAATNDAEASSPVSLGRAFRELVIAASSLLIRSLDHGVL
jgi:hypothetical protein